MLHFISLNVYYGYSLCQTPQRLLSGTISVLLNSLDGALENSGVRPLSRKVEIWKLILTFLDVYYGYSLCQKPPRLLSGTSSILLDSLDDALENPWVWPLSRRVEMWKLVCSFLYVSQGHPLCQQPPRLLSGTSSVLLDPLDDALEKFVPKWSWRTR